MKLNTISKELVNKLKEKKLTIATAESCTGGLIASSIISVPGASYVINESYITYSNESKIKILGVDQKTINEYGVQSEQVAHEMVYGVYNNSLANVCVSVTGFTKGEEDLETDGLFYYGILTNINDSISVKIYHDQVFGKTREDIREKQVNIILKKILEIIKKTTF